MKVQFLLIAALLVSFESHATTCLAYKPEDLIKKQKYIFTGKVLKVSKDEVVMEVSESFGAPVSKRVILDFNRLFFLSGDMGTQGYSVGNEYLIYTNNFKSIDNGNFVFKLKVCDMQREAKREVELLKWLKEFKGNSDGLQK